MKNNEKLLDIIGEINGKAVPDVPEKRPSTLWMKLSAAGCGIGAAALLGIVILGGGGREQPPYGGGSSDVITNYAPEQSTPITDTTPEGSETTEKEPPVSETTTNSEPPVSEDHTVTLYPDFDYEPSLKALADFSANITDIKGAGFDGVSSYDFFRFQYNLSRNPWNEMVFDTLPVFRNNALSQYSHTEYLTAEKMKEMAENTACGLGTGIAAIEGQDMALPSRIAADCTDGTVIQVYGNGEIYIAFDTAVPLPEGYSYFTPADKEKAMMYLVEKYNRLFGFENPDFFSYSEITESIFIYDRSGGHVREMLNYGLYYARLLLDDDGAVSRIIITNALRSSTYMGDYPVISLSEALAMLLEGKFLACVMEDYINGGAIFEEDIVACELVYRLDGYEEYFQPYYCFYVVADMGKEFEERYSGLTNYAALYVPAVTEEYIEDFTDWYTPYGGDYDS